MIDIEFVCGGIVEGIVVEIGTGQDDDLLLVLRSTADLPREYASH